MTDPLSPLAPEPSLAFDELVRAHYGRLCNFGYRFVGSRDVAEDIVQDVFARLWRQQDAFDVKDPLPYLYQAVRNRAVSHRRQQDVRERSSERVTMGASERGRLDASAEVEASELAAAAAAAVEALPQRCRLIYTMSREQDLTYAEIAKTLGISIKTVEAQMGRALKALRARLVQYLSLAAAAVSAGRMLG